MRKIWKDTYGNAFKHPDHFKFIQGGPKKKKTLLPKSIPAVFIHTGWRQGVILEAIFLGVLLEATL